VLHLTVVAVESQDYSSVIPKRKSNFCKSWK